MRSAAGPDFRRSPRHRRAEAGLPTTDDDPDLAIVYQLAEAVMEIAGPLFWVILALAFVAGPLGIHVFR